MKHFIENCDVEMDEYSEKFLAARIYMRPASDTNIDCSTSEDLPEKAERESLVSGEEETYDIII